MFLKLTGSRNFKKSAVIITLLAFVLQPIVLCLPTAVWATETTKEYVDEQVNNTAVTQGEVSGDGDNAITLKNAAGTAVATVDLSTLKTAQGNTLQGYFDASGNAKNASHAAAAETAVKATQDGNGAVIAETYQTKLTEAQLAAANSGIDATKVAQIETNATDIATINDSAVMKSGITAADVAQITTNKTNIATNATDIATNTTAIANIVNGTTVVGNATNATNDSAGNNIASTYAKSADVYAKTETYSSSEIDTKLGEKQGTLSEAQLAAANSGITADKVAAYDGYATTIAGKADKATTLEGYGITDAYTKSEVDTAVGVKANASEVYTKTVADSTFAAKSVESSVTALQDNFTDGAAKKAIADGAGNNISATYATKTTVNGTYNAATYADNKLTLTKVNGEQTELTIVAGGEGSDTLAVHYDDIASKALVTLQGADGTEIANVKAHTLEANGTYAATTGQVYAEQQLREAAGKMTVNGMGTAINGSSGINFKGDSNITLTGTAGTTGEVEVALNNDIVLDSVTAGTSANKAVISDNSVKVGSSTLTATTLTIGTEADTKTVVTDGSVAVGNKVSLTAANGLKVADNYTFNKEDGLQVGIETNLTSSKLTVGGTTGAALTSSQLTIGSAAVLTGSALTMGTDDNTKAVIQDNLVSVGTDAKLTSTELTMGTDSAQKAVVKSGLISVGESANLSADKLTVGASSLTGTELNVSGSTLSNTQLKVSGTTVDADGVTTGKVKVGTNTAITDGDIALGSGVSLNSVNGLTIGTEADTKTVVTDGSVAVSNKVSLTAANGLKVADNYTFNSTNGLQVGTETNLTSSKLTVESSSLTTDTLTVGGYNYITASGISANNTQIKDVASAGNIALDANKKNAVNAGDLYGEVRPEEGVHVNATNTTAQNLKKLDDAIKETIEHGYTFGDGTNSSDIALGKKVTVKGTAGKNITTTFEEVGGDAVIDIALDPDIVVNSLTAGTSANKAVISDNSVKVGSSTLTATTLTVGNATATGNNSVAIGSGSNASASYAVAMGKNTNAVGQYAVAMGNGAGAYGNNSVAIGNGSNASASYAVAMGKNTNASGQYAMAMGSGSNASASYAVAMGKNTNAAGQYAVAMGNGAGAYGNNSVAIGSGSNASASYAVAFGQNTNASGEYSMAMGKNSNASGQYAMAVGQNTNASGKYAVAIGENSNASGSYSVAVGSNANANEANSFAFGGTVETGATNGVAIGQGSSVTGQNSVALGAGSVASGDNEISVGDAASGLTRKITNVASAGTLSDTNTNAANGADIYNETRAAIDDTTANYIAKGNTAAQNLKALDDKLGKVTTTINGVSESNTFAANIDALNNTLGDQFSLASTNYITNGQNVATNLAALDSAIGDKTIYGTYINASDKSVNENLKALDDVIGEQITGNYIGKQATNTVYSDLKALDDQVKANYDNEIKEMTLENRKTLVATKNDGTKFEVDLSEVKVKEAESLNNIVVTPGPGADETTTQSISATATGGMTIGKTVNNSSGVPIEDVKTAIDAGSVTTQDFLTGKSTTQNANGITVTDGSNTASLTADELSVAGTTVNSSGVATSNVTATGNMSANGSITAGTGADTVVLSGGNVTAAYEVKGATLNATSNLTVAGGATTIDPAGVNTNKVTVGDATNNVVVADGDVTATGALKGKTLEGTESLTVAAESSNKLIANSAGVKVGTDTDNVALANGNVTATGNMSANGSIMAGTGTDTVVLSSGNVTAAYEVKGTTLNATSSLIVAGATANEMFADENGLRIGSEGTTLNSSTLTMGGGATLNSSELKIGSASLNSSALTVDTTSTLTGTELNVNGSTLNASQLSVAGTTVNASGIVTSDPNVKFTTAGISAGNQQVTNVASAGGIVENGTNAVNAGDIFAETRVTSVGEGSYLSTTNSAAQNIAALDNAIGDNRIYGTWINASSKSVNENLKVLDDVLTEGYTFGDGVNSSSVSLGKKVDIAGGTSAAGNKNITTAFGKDTAGNARIDVVLNDDIVVNSVVAGSTTGANTNINAVGVMVTDGISNAVASLKANELSVAGTVVDSAGVSTSNVMATGNITALNSVTAGAGANKVVMSENSVKVGSGAELTSTALKVGGATVDGSGIVTSNPNVKFTTNGISAGGQKISNVQSGVLSADSTDVVTGTQLFETNQTIEKLQGNLAETNKEVQQVGAMSAALAGLHYVEPSGEDGDKFSGAASYGGYRGESAAAVGVAYKPNPNLMLSASTSVGNNQNMYNAGVAFKFGPGKTITRSELKRQIKAVNDKSDQVQLAVQEQNNRIAKVGSESAQMKGAMEQVVSENAQLRSALEEMNARLEKVEKAQRGHKSSIKQKSRKNK